MSTKTNKETEISYYRDIEGNSIHCIRGDGDESYMEGLTKCTEQEEISYLNFGHFDATEEDMEIFNSSSKPRKKLIGALTLGVTTEDGKMWFNEETLIMFVTTLTTVDDDEMMLWKDANRDVVSLTRLEAKAYAKEARISIQDIYKLKG